MGVFLKRISASSRIGCIVYLFAMCWYAGHKICFLSPVFLFLPDSRLVPNEITSANFFGSVKKITPKRLADLRKALIIKARTPLVFINTLSTINSKTSNGSLLLLDSYKLVPAYWYKPESFADIRHITVEDPYKLDAHAWCTLYHFVNTLPDWLYTKYSITWHSQTYITAQTKHKSLAIKLILTAFTTNFIDSERMHKALESIYSMLVSEHEQKTKQQKKLYESKVWSIDARYDNRLIVRCVEGGGVS